MRAVLFIFLTSLTVSSYAQAVRKYSNEFLKIGVGARGIGLGNTLTASVDDITAAYYNPAGLVRIKGNLELGLMHSEYFASIAKYDYAAIAMPMNTKRKALAFSFIRMGIDDIPNTLNLINIDGTVDYNKVTLFNVSDWAFLTSYSSYLFKDNDKWSLGANAKVIYRNYGTFSHAWGFGLDAGIQYHHKKLKFGVMAQDITTTFNAWSFSFTEDEKKILVSSGNTLPESSLEITAPTIRIGGAYSIGIKDKVEVTPSLDLITHTDGRRNVLFKTSPLSFDLTMGIEVLLWKMVYVRGGFYNIQEAQDVQGEKYMSIQPNVGAGLKFKSLNIDYTYSNVGASQTSGVGLYSHTASLIIHLKRSTTPSN